MGHELTTSSGLFLVATAVLGALCWSFVEYGIHGLLAHRFRTPVSPIHWSHHRTPAAVFTSPVAWLPIAVAVSALATWAVGPARAAAFTAGLLAGFLRYEYVHWRVHFREPRSHHQARLRDHHLAHHFVNPSAYHGVTTRFWDRVFRSLPKTWKRDYARASVHPPIGGASNLCASWNPRAIHGAIANAIRQGDERPSPDS
jgi:hypothetical protein